MKNIKDYSLEELKEELKEMGEKPFRAEQIYKWIYESRVSNFDEMTNLSLELREKLKKDYEIKEFKIITKQVSSDGTIFADFILLVFQIYNSRSDVFKIYRLRQNIFAFFF